MGVNQVTNGSFETDLTNWQAFNSRLTLTRVEGGYDGGFSARIAPQGTAIGSCSAAYTERIPCNPGDYVVAAAYFRWAGGATVKQTRVWIRFYDATGTSLGTFASQARTPPLDGSWFLNLNNDNQAPAGAVECEIRMLVLSGDTGDLYDFDAVMVTVGPNNYDETTLPPFGGDAASGAASGSLSLSGSATGATAREGIATGSLALDGEAMGRAQHGGHALGSLPISGQADGTSPASGTASGSLSLTGSATGSTRAARDLVITGVTGPTSGWTQTAPGHEVRPTTAPTPTISVASTPGNHWTDTEPLALSTIRAQAPATTTTADEPDLDWPTTAPTI